MQQRKSGWTVAHSVLGHGAMQQGSCVTGSVPKSVSGIPMPAAVVYTAAVRAAKTKSFIEKVGIAISMHLSFRIHILFRRQGVSDYHQTRIC